MSTGPIAAHQNPVEGAERPYFGRFRTRTASVCVCVCERMAFRIGHTVRLSALQ